MDAGLTPGVQAIKDLKPKVLFLLGADEGKVNAEDLARKLEEKVVFSLITS